MALGATLGASPDIGRLLIQLNQRLIGALVGSTTPTQDSSGHISDGASSM